MKSHVSDAPGATVWPRKAAAHWGAIESAPVASVHASWMESMTTGIVDVLVKTARNGTSTPWIGAVSDLWKLPSPSASLVLSKLPSTGQMTVTTTGFESTVVTLLAVAWPVLVVSPQAAGVAVTRMVIVADFVPLAALAAARSPTLQLMFWPDGAEHVPAVVVGVPLIERPAGMVSVTTTALAVAPPVLWTTRV